MQDSREANDAMVARRWRSTAVSVGTCRRAVVLWVKSADYRPWWRSSKDCRECVVVGFAIQLLASLYIDSSERAQPAAYQQAHRLALLPNTIAKETAASLSRVYSNFSARHVAISQGLREASAESTWFQRTARMAMSCSEPGPEPVRGERQRWFAQRLAARRSFLLRDPRPGAEGDRVDGSSPKSGRHGIVVMAFCRCCI